MKAFEYVERTVCACGEPLKDISCNIQKFYPWGHVTFVQCRACLSWVQSPQITNEILKLWYDSNDYQSAGNKSEGAYIDYHADEAQRKKEALCRYKRDLKPLLGAQSRVCEVGCATGSLLSVLREDGHKVFGVDLSPKFAEKARILYGIDVAVRDFLEMKAPKENVDMIIMLGTISNLQYLERHIEQARKFLKADGFLYANFPAADSWIARLYGKRFWMFAPSVINFLSMDGCRRTLKTAGFNIVKIGHDHQRPTLSKMLGHAGLRGIYPIVRSCGISDFMPPFDLPIPGVFSVLAQKQYELEKT